MKSQAVAFLLGFALTSLVLLCIPGVYKNTSKTGSRGEAKLASVIKTSGDSSIVNNNR